MNPSNFSWRAVATRRVIAPLWAAWERSPYLAHYHRLRQTQYLPPEEVRRRQLGQVRDIVAHAYATVPFYRRRLRECGLHPADVLGFDDFRQIPVLTKDDLRSQAADLRSIVSLDWPVRRKKTSGSTGQSLEVIVDEDSMQFKRGCTLRSDEWSGWRLGEPVAKLWGNPEYLKHGWRGRLRNALLDRAVYLDTLRMDQAVLRQFTAQLLAARPTLVFGHAHSVYLFAEYVRHHAPAGYRPRGVITTAMVLHDWQRRVIEDVFGCPVTNRYGCEEVSLIASQCEEHQGLHVNADSVYVEILADGRPAAPGEPGKVVVTDLTNRAMPIIRYEVGDVSAWARRACPCGRGLPTLDRIEGRESDFLVTPRGGLISGISMTENFAVLVPGVAQFQLVQETVTSLRCRVVKTPDFGDASLARMRELIDDLLGPEVDFTCEFLPRIPPEPSGKYRFCKSLVARSAVHLGVAAEIAG